MAYKPDSVLTTYKDASWYNRTQVVQLTLARSAELALLLVLASWLATVSRWQALFRNQAGVSFVVTC